MKKITTLMFCASLLMAQGNSTADQALEKQIAHQKKMAEQFLMEKKRYDQIVHQEKMAEQFLLAKKAYDEKEAEAKKMAMAKKESAKKKAKKQASVKKKKAAPKKVSKQESTPKVVTVKQPVVKKEVQKGHKTGFDHLKSLGL
jgi:FKBP-type peptidyl-prolyl cis-trans isomerase